jgi:hypothetical protein
MVKIFLSTQRFRVQSFSQLFLPTHKMDEKKKKTFKYFLKVNCPLKTTSPEERRQSVSPK